MKLLLAFQGNLGYAADQVHEDRTTILDLIEALQEAYEEHGDLEIVTFQTNNGRGANYGALSTDRPFTFTENGLPA